MQRMSFSENPSVSYVVERDIDLVVVQLLQSSTEFRRWFAREHELDTPVEGFLGVRQSVYTENGESDVEVGFETQTGSHHVVLIENKIDASLQNRQVERYYERGEKYLEDGWDAFTICLVAPQDYVSRDDQRGFEVIVTYEDILDVVESLDHDGSEFFGEIFQRSLEKRIPADHSDLTAAIRERILSRAEELPDVRVYQTSNTQVRLESTHEHHPSPVLYNAHIPGPYDGDKAIVRVNLTGRDSYSNEEVTALQELLAHELESPDGFELRERPMDVVRKDVSRADFGSREAYLDHITEELSALVAFYHARLTRADLLDESK